MAARNRQDSMAKTDNKKDQIYTSVFLFEETVTHIQPKCDMKSERI